VFRRHIIPTGIRFVPYRQTRSLQRKRPIRESPDAEPGTPLIKSHFVADLRPVFPRHQLTGGQSELRWFFAVDDPIVHIQGSLVPVALGANQNRPEETRWLGFLELVQRGRGAADSHSDHTVGLIPATLSGSDRAQDGLIIQAKGNPLVKLWIFCQRDICSIEGVLGVRFGLRRVDDILLGK